MFNLGLSELIIIGIIALIFIGPKELPEVARVLGRLLNELRRATGDIKDSFLDAKPDLSHLNEYHIPEHKQPEAPSQEEANKEAQDESKS